MQQRSEETELALVQALYAEIKRVMVEHGYEHGHASVVELPNGLISAVAGPSGPITLGGEQPDEEEFKAGGGSFGGGGASGTW